MREGEHGTESGWPCLFTRFCLLLQITMNVEKDGGLAWETKISIGVALVTLFLLIFYQRQPKKGKKKFRVFLPQNETVYSLRSRLLRSPVVYNLYIVCNDLNSYFVDLQIKFFLESCTDGELKSLFLDFHNLPLRIDTKLNEVSFKPRIFHG